MDVVSSTYSPDVELKLSAIAELSEISKEILRQEDVRNEVFDVAMQPRYLDRYIALSDLLKPRTDDAEKLVPSRTPGTFRRAFDVAFDEATYPNLAQYVRTNKIESRSGPAEELYFYCPYCEKYSDAQVDNGFTVAPNLAVESSNAESGSQPQADGSYKTVTVDDDYAAKTPTMIVTGQPDGGLSILACTDNITLCSNGQCCDYCITEGPAGPVRTLERCYPDPNGGGTPPPPPGT